MLFSRAEVQQVAKVCVNIEATYIFNSLYDVWSHHKREKMKNFLIKIAITLGVVAVSMNVNGQEYRQYNGYENNLGHPTWGQAFSNFQHIASPQFADGMSEPIGLDRPNARVVSNLIFGQGDGEFHPNELGISDFGWNFGQFIDHETTLNLDNHDEFMPIAVPECDPMFDPMCTGQVIIPFRRSGSDAGTGTSTDKPRAFTNDLTSFIDASAVYGVSEERANWLRSFEDGKLKTSAGNLLPYNTLTGEYDSPIDAFAPEMINEIPSITRFFIAGDKRANEQPGLTCMHTLFMREHNRMCDEIKDLNPDWTDEQIFQRARRYVGAFIQVILETEFLPALGIDLGPYQGYDGDAKPSIFNTFSAAGFRLGHTLVNDQLIRLQDNGDTLLFGSIHIKDAFFNTDFIRLEGGIAPIFKGMATQKQQTFDTKIVTTLRNFLFGQPGTGGLDLVSLNLQRGRDRGLMDYNSTRVAFGLTPVSTFDEITDDVQIATLLETLYGDVNNMDVWPGMLAEPHAAGAAIGELAQAILSMQFDNIRKGDRFWYQNDPDFTAQEKEIISRTTMSQIVLRNTSITNLQDNVFFAEEHTLTSIEVEPFDNIRRIELSAYPNPVVRHVSLYVKTNNREKGTLTVNDLSGTEIFSQKVTLRSGENNLEFELPEAITSGLYVINYSSKNAKGSFSIVKQ